MCFLYEGKKIMAFSINNGILVGKVSQMNFKDSKNFSTLKAWPKMKGQLVSQEKGR